MVDLTPEEYTKQLWLEREDFTCPSCGADEAQIDSTVWEEADD